MAAPAQKTEAAQELLSRYAAPVGGVWFQQARSDAEARLHAMGAPIKRDEYWKFTDPTPLTSAAPASSKTQTISVIDHADPVKIVITDGVVDLEASDDFELEGLTIDRLENAVKADIHWVKDFYGQLETAGQDPVHRPLAALNTARATTGLCLHASSKVSRPISIIYHNAADGDLIAHHIVKVDSGAELTLIEETSTAGRSNIVTEVDIADHGVFHHLKLQAPEKDVLRSSHMFAQLGEESVLKSLTVSVNGRYTRNESVITFKGDNAFAHVAGAAAGNGKDFHHDDTVFVTHDAVNCESRQVFKKVLRNGATGVFQGKILVQPDAQKTDGYQISQGLLLDDDSQFLAKPELEIYADDVACSHGSTVGAIDETAVFYLTSRGVPRVQAVNMLVLAFLGEALDELADPDLAERVGELLAKWKGHTDL